jgi:hypothetical protein
MNAKMAGLAAMALICAAGASQAQPYGGDRRGDRWGPGRGGQIALYPNPDFRGRPFNTAREYSNLPRPYNDGAMSLEVRGGAWEVCVDSDFRGRCQVVTRDVRDLRAIGLGGVISSVRPVRDGGWGGGRPGGGWDRPGGGRGGVATLFDGSGFSGRGFSTNREYSNLPRQDNDRAHSLRIEGRGAWEVCSDANFRGRCQVFTRDVPDLGVYGLAEAISSIRPAN